MIVNHNKRNGYFSIMKHYIPKNDLCIENASQNFSQSSSKNLLMSFSLVKYFIFLVHAPRFDGWIDAYFRDPVDLTF